MKDYGSGIINDKNCDGNLNHASLAVGYDLNHKIPHVILKNSWSTDYGEEGYYRMALGNVTRDSKGICNMFTHGANIFPTFN